MTAAEETGPDEADVREAVRRLGRMWKRNEERSATVMRAMLGGATMTEAATRAGVHENTVIAWCKKARLRIPRSTAGARAGQHPTTAAVRQVIKAVPEAEIMKHLFAKRYPRCPVCGKEAAHVRRATAGGKRLDGSARWIGRCAEHGTWDVPRRAVVRQPLLKEWRRPGVKAFLALVAGGVPILRARKLAGLKCQHVTDLITEELLCCFGRKVTEPEEEASE